MSTVVSCHSSGTLSYTEECCRVAWVNLSLTHGCICSESHCVIGDWMHLCLDMSASSIRPLNLCFSNAYEAKADFCAEATSCACSVCHVRYRGARAAGCARWPEAGASAHLVCNA